MLKMITYSDAVVAKNNSPAIIANNELKFGTPYQNQWYYEIKTTKW